MTLFLGSRPNCCRRPALGICWSIDFRHVASGYTDDGDHAFEAVPYHLMQLDERTGTILWDRTIDDWVGTYSTIATYLPGRVISDWVIETEGEEVQQKLDRWASCGSLAVDPSGDWAVFANRRRLIIGKTTLDEVWDCHPDVIGDETTCRQFTAMLFNQPHLDPGGLIWRVAGKLYGGNLPPFDVMPTNFSGASTYGYSSVSEGTIYRASREIVYYFNNNDIPFFQRGSDGERIDQPLYSVRIPPNQWWYRSFVLGMSAMADGSIVAYQTNNPHRNDDVSPGRYAWEFAKYNDSVIWSTSTTIYDEDGDFVRAGIEGGIWVGANSDRTKVGVIWTESSTELIFQTCDTFGETAIQTIDIPEDYPSPEWSHFGQTPYGLYSPISERALTPIWGPASNSLIFCFRGAPVTGSVSRIVFAKYDLDAAEWRWFRELPNEFDLPIGVWAMAAKSQ